MKKRIFSLLLALVLCLALMPMAALAGDGEKTWTEPDSDNIYTLKDGVLTITGEAINPDWASNGEFDKSSVTSLVIGDGITVIEMSAFDECENLESVVMADSVWMLGSSAFANCTSLKTVYLSSGIVNIQNRVFYGIAGDVNVYYKGTETDLKEVFKAPVEGNPYDWATNIKLNCNHVHSFTGGQCECGVAGYAVTFDSNGGSAVDKQNVQKGLTATAPTDPTREGFNFAGWYEKDSAGAFGDTAFDFTTVLTADITLYAKWECAGHTGGTADCKNKAVCTVCGEEYGELGTHDYSAESKDAEGALKTAGDCQHEAVYYKSCSACGAVSTSDTDTFKGDKDPSNHPELKHVEAKAATTEAEGNKEYWHCEDCGKYYGDEDGEKEIDEADTVIEKLTPEATPTAAPTSTPTATATPAPTAKPAQSPKTGDEANVVLWLALAMVSVMGIAVVGRKKVK